MAILVLLIKRDVPQFVAVFLVTIFSLGGALYFALIGDYNEESLRTVWKLKTTVISCRIVLYR